MTGGTVYSRHRVDHAGPVNSVAILATVASLWFVAAVTPGPNSVLLMRQAIIRPRGEALACVLGIGLGTLVWGLCGFFGVHALFLAAPLLYWAFKLCGGLYLVFYGARLIWISFRDGEEIAPGPGRFALSPFRIGLFTSLSNPKSALSVAGLFAATMPSHAPIDLGVASVCLMVAVSLGWYSLLVMFFGGAWMAAFYRRLRRRIDRIAGAIFIALGARLVWQR